MIFRTSSLSYWLSNVGDRNLSSDQSIKQHIKKGVYNRERFLYEDGYYAYVLLGDKSEDQVRQRVHRSMYKKIKRTSSRKETNLLAYWGINCLVKESEWVAEHHPELVQQVESHGMPAHYTPSFKNSQRSVWTKIRRRFFRLFVSQPTQDAHVEQAIQALVQWVGLRYRDDQQTILRMCKQSIVSHAEVMETAKRLQRERTRIFEQFKKEVTNSNYFPDHANLYHQLNTIFGEAESALSLLDEFAYHCHVSQPRQPEQYNTYNLTDEYQLGDWLALVGEEISPKYKYQIRRSQNDATDNNSRQLKYSQMPDEPVFSFMRRHSVRSYQGLDYLLARSNWIQTHQTTNCSLQVANDLPFDTHYDRAQWMNPKKYRNYAIKQLKHITRWVGEHYYRDHLKLKKVIQGSSLSETDIHDFYQRLHSMRKERWYRFKKKMGRPLGFDQRRDLFERIDALYASAEQMFEINHLFDSFYYRDFLDDSRKDENLSYWMQHLVPRLDEQRPFVTESSTNCTPMNNSKTHHNIDKMINEKTLSKVSNIELRKQSSQALRSLISDSEWIDKEYPDIKKSVRPFRWLTARWYLKQRSVWQRFKNWCQGIFRSRKRIMSPKKYEQHATASLSRLAQWIGLKYTADRQRIYALYQEGYMTAKKLKHIECMQDQWCRQRVKSYRQFKDRCMQGLSKDQQKSLSARLYNLWREGEDRLDVQCQFYKKYPASGAQMGLDKPLSTVSLHREKKQHGDVLSKLPLVLLERILNQSESLLAVRGVNRSLRRNTDLIALQSMSPMSQKIKLILITRLLRNPSRLQSLSNREKNDWYYLLTAIQKNPVTWTETRMKCQVLLGQIYDIGKEDQLQILKFYSRLRVIPGSANALPINGAQLIPEAIDQQGRELATVPREIVRQCFGEEVGCDFVERESEFKRTLQGALEIRSRKQVESLCKRSPLPVDEAASFLLLTHYNNETALYAFSELDIDQLSPHKATVIYGEMAKQLSRQSELFSKKISSLLILKAISRVEKYVSQQCIEYHKISISNSVRKMIESINADCILSANWKDQANEIESLGDLLPEIPFLFTYMNTGSLEYLCQWIDKQLSKNRLTRIFTFDFPVGFIVEVRCQMLLSFCKHGDQFSDKYPVTLDDIATCARYVEFKKLVILIDQLNDKSKCQLVAQLQSEIDSLGTPGFFGRFRNKGLVNFLSLLNYYNIIPAGDVDHYDRIFIYIMKNLHRYSFSWAESYCSRIDSYGSNLTVRRYKWIIPEEIKNVMDTREKFDQIAPFMGLIISNVSPRALSEIVGSFVVPDYLPSSVGRRVLLLFFNKLSVKHQDAIIDALVSSIRVRMPSEGSCASSLLINLTNQLATERQIWVSKKFEDSITKGLCFIVRHNGHLLGYDAAAKNRLLTQFIEYLDHICCLGRRPARKKEFINVISMNLEFIPEHMVLKTVSIFKNEINLNSVYQVQKAIFNVLVHFSQYCADSLLSRMSVMLVTFFRDFHGDKSEFMFSYQLLVSLQKRLKNNDWQSSDHALVYQFQHVIQFVPESFLGCEDLFKSTTHFINRVRVTLHHQTNQSRGLFIRRLITQLEQPHPKNMFGLVHALIHLMDVLQADREVNSLIQAIKSIVIKALSNPDFEVQSAYLTLWMYMSLFYPSEMRLEESDVRNYSTAVVQCFQAVSDAVTAKRDAIAAEMQAASSRLPAHGRVGLFAPVNDQNASADDGLVSEGSASMQANV